MLGHAFLLNGPWNSQKKMYLNGITGKSKEEMRRLENGDISLDVGKPIEKFSEYF
jgi:hypothetical protein